MYYVLRVLICSTSRDVGFTSSANWLENNLGLGNISHQVRKLAILINGSTISSFSRAVYVLVVSWVGSLTVVVNNSHSWKLCTSCRSRERSNAFNYKRLAIFLFTSFTCVVYRSLTFLFSLSIYTNSNLYTGCVSSFLICAHFSFLWTFIFHCSLDFLFL